MIQHIVTNSAQNSRVTEQTIDGDRHLVAEDVTFIRPMRLAGGYVPSDEVAESADNWEGDELTLNHAKNRPDRPWFDPDLDARFLSANATAETEEKKVIGHAVSPSRQPDGSVNGDLAVNADRLEELANGEAIDEAEAEDAQALLDALKNQEPFDVSSTYFPRDLPAGVYDGCHRDDVEGIGETDSIALLPNKEGVCSLSDGCGFGADQVTANVDGDTDNVARVPVANAAVDDIEIGDRVIWPSQGDRPAAGIVRELKTEGQYDSELGGQSYVNSPAVLVRVFRPDDSDEWQPSDAMHAHRVSTVTVVEDWPDLEADDDPDDPTGARPSGSDATGNADSGESPLDEDDMSDGKLREIGRQVASVFGLSDSGEQDGNKPAEAGADAGDAPAANADPDPDDPGEPMDRQELIDEITANSVIEKDSLTGMGDQCLEATHQNVVGNGSEEEDEDGDDNTESGGSGEEQTLADLTVEDLGDELADQGFVTEEDISRVVANAQEQSSKKQRVGRIIANSTEYTDDDRDTLMDTPDDVLSDIETGVSASSTLPGRGGSPQAGGATANADPEEYSDGTVGGR